MIPGTTYIRTWYVYEHLQKLIFRLMRYTDVWFFSLSGGCTTLYYTKYSFIRWWLAVRMIPTFRPRNSCIAICLFVSGWWYAWYLRSAQETAVSLFVYSLVGGGITRTFRPWTHTSDDSYIYQLSLVVATATVSFYFMTIAFTNLINIMLLNFDASERSICSAHSAPLPWFFFKSKTEIERRAH